MPNEQQPINQDAIDEKITVNRQKAMEIAAQIIDADLSLQEGSVVERLLATSVSEEAEAMRGYLSEIILLLNYRNQPSPWHSFPHQGESEEGLALAGSLVYQPALRLPPTLTRRFQHILNDERGFSVPGTHPRIEADWSLVRQEQESVPLYTRVVLFSDGTDRAAKNEHWEDAGVLFYRQDSYPPLFEDVTHSLHIPEQREQDKLLNCATFLHELPTGQVGQFLTIQTYLSAILDRPFAWLKQAPYLFHGVTFQREARK